MLDIITVGWGATGCECGNNRHSNDFRKEMHEYLKKSRVGKTGQKDVLSFRHNEKLALAWMYKRLVTVVSTFHTRSRNKMTEVFFKYPNRSPVLEPNVVFVLHKIYERN
jgi:hypothetical protein